MDRSSNNCPQNQAQPKHQNRKKTVKINKYQLRSFREESKYYQNLSISLDNKNIANQNEKKKQKKKGKEDRN